MFRLQQRLPDDYSTAPDDELAAASSAARGRARQAARHPRAPLPARGGDASSRTREVTRTGCPVSLRTSTKPSSSSSAASTSWPSRPTSSPALTSRSSCPTSTPAARWQTWPTSTPSSRSGRSSPRSPTSTRIVPITYMNSAASLKAFVGAQGRRRLHLLERPRRAHLGARPDGQRPSGEDGARRP